MSCLHRDGSPVVVREDRRVPLHPRGHHGRHRGGEVVGEEGGGREAKVYARGLSV